LDLIHEIDYIYWFFGKPLNVHKVLKNNSSLKIESTDFANYSLDYGDFIASITLNYYRRDAKRTLEIITNKCTVSVDLLKNSVFENNELVYSREQTMAETFEKQLVWFIENQLTGSGNNFNDIDEAFEVLKISLA
jgi:predicted dehydrogenase